MRRFESTRAIAIATGALAIAACTGKVSGGDLDNGGAEATEAPRFARLTHAQWENTVQDLFNLPAPPALATAFYPDPQLGRFDNNIARLAVTAGLWQDYQRAAELIAEQVVADQALFAGILPADLPSDPAAAGRAFVESFGARAFRRPLTDAELDAYASMFATGPTHFPEDDALHGGARLVIASMLQSPWFLYRAETSTGEGSTVQLSGYEVASRLSYALWNTMPDPALFADAADGALDDEDGLRAAAERLWAEERTHGQFDHFHFQAFELREYTDVDKDGEMFPEWGGPLAEAMQAEANLFLSGVVFDEGAIGDLLTSTRAHVNADLAAVYGLSGEFGAEMVEVELDATRRAGFLTRVGFLARNGTLTEPDPIHRGVFINRQIICRDIAAVPNLPDNLMPVGDTNRERIESINGVGTCGEGCHATTINPPGFALEHFDAIGRWRDDDNGFPIDTADTYVFEDGRELTFTDAVDLSRQLAEAPEVHACYVGQLLEYLYGRDLTADDQPLVDELAEQSRTERLSVREIVMRAVTSNAFRYRPAGK